VISLNRGLAVNIDGGDMAQETVIIDHIARLATHVRYTDGAVSFVYHQTFKDRLACHDINLMQTRLNNKGKGISVLLI
jgi:hypothetical protein